MPPPPLAGPWLIFKLTSRRHTSQQLSDRRCYVVSCQINFHVFIWSVCPYYIKLCIFVCVPVYNRFIRLVTLDQMHLLCPLTGIVSMNASHRKAKVIRHRAQRPHLVPVFVFTETYHTKCKCHSTLRFTSCNVTV